jgi:hypothetical protein
LWVSKANPQDRDDLARLRTDHGPQNMAVIKPCAINLVHTAAPIIRLKNHRNLALWHRDYRETLIRQTA